LAIKLPEVKKYQKFKWNDFKNVTLHHKVQ